jgi:hypothetical protein
MKFLLWAVKKPLTSIGFFFQKNLSYLKRNWSCVYEHHWSREFQDAQGILVRLLVKITLKPLILVFKLIEITFTSMRCNFFSENFCEILSYLIDFKRLSRVLKDQDFKVSRVQLFWIWFWEISQRLNINSFIHIHSLPFGQNTHANINLTLTIKEIFQTMRIFRYDLPTKLHSNNPFPVLWYNFTDFGN